MAEVVGLLRIYPHFDPPYLVSTLGEVHEPDGVVMDRKTSFRLDLAVHLGNSDTRIGVADDRLDNIDL